MKCSVCGKENILDAKFCKYCGAEMNKRQASYSSVTIQNNSQELKNEMTKGSKIWFWFVIIVNILSAVSGLILISSMPDIGILSVISGIVLAIGAGIILFKHKKLGWYLIAGMAVVNCFINVVNGVGIIGSVLSSVLCPAISYYFMNKNSNIIK